MMKAMTLALLSLVAAVSASEPLNLSPFARDNDIRGALKASEVHLPNDPLNLTSYSGFVETTPGRHMFMWYFPAQNGDADAPLTIWLQGGPGGSSLFGLFSEMGPYSLSPEMQLLDRPYSWNKNYGMLFIDNPVGAGFSYPDTLDAGPRGFCTNTKTCVADNLYELMQTFYTLFPAQLQVPLYITGESYGGHYVPAFAYKVHVSNAAMVAAKSGDSKARTPLNSTHNGHAPIFIPLAGIAVGDGWIDPVNMVPAYPDMMFNFGLCSEKQKVVITDYCDRTVAFIKSGNLTAAFDVWDEMLNGDIYPYPNYFHNITGSNDYDNFLRTDAPSEFNLFSPYVKQPAVRAAMHTGQAVFGDNAGKCEINLVADFHVSLAPELITLLEHPELYRVFIYSGQLDVIIGAPLTEAFMRVLPWSGLAEYNDADRKIWMDTASPAVHDKVSGYVRTVKNMSQIIIRGAGHIAPYDQPRRSRDMIDKLIGGTPF